MTQPPLARPAARLPGETQAAFVERVGVSHEKLKEHGIGGIEYLRQLGSNPRIDTDRSVYGGNGYGHEPNVNELLAMLKARVAEEKDLFATEHDVDPREVFCKVGAGAEITQGRRCLARYNDKVQYPTGLYCEKAGGLTPAVFDRAENGQLLMHGVASNVLLSVLEASTGAWNNV